VVKVQEPNYKNYTLAELEDVLAHIDKDAFSERYQNALAHYQQKLKDRQAVQSNVDLEDNLQSGNQSSDDKLYLQFIILLVVNLLFGWKVVNAVLTGVTRTKRGELITLASDSSGFYNHIAFEVVMLGGCLLIFFRVYKKLAAADTQKTESVDAKR
jgi:hypothetical protein